VRLAFESSFMQLIVRLSTDHSACTRCTTRARAEATSPSRGRASRTRWRPSGASRSTPTSPPSRRRPKCTHPPPYA
jgi:hypothetical protein